MVTNAASSDINSIFSVSTAATKRDPGGIGFIDAVGGSVDGLMSCTESLGFESSDERRGSDDDQLIIGRSKGIDELCSRKSIGTNTVSSKWKSKDIKRNFPPPLSTLTQDGKPTFFLRPVRRDGRLKLTEVKICRPEILRASRQDGRLKLHFICDHEDDEDDEDNIEEKQIQEGEGNGEMFEKNLKKPMKLETVEEEIIEEEEEEEEEEEAERAEKWHFPAAGGGDGFRRCYEEVNHHHRSHNHHHHRSHHHQHEIHAWRQQFVTIR